MSHVLRSPIARKIATSRSAISNGRKLLPGVDGRSAQARRFRDLIIEIEHEIGGDLSEVERGLAKQAAALALQAEGLQAKIVRGEDVDHDALIRLTSEARRIVSTISGKAEKRKPAGPTLQSFLERKAAEKATTGGER